jgi:ABC-2 type transport system permease protein
MKTFGKLLVTEFKRIFSNNTLISVFILSPILFGVVFANVYKKGKLTELSLVVIDEDHTSLSGKIIDALDDNENIKVISVQNEAGNIAAEMPSKEYIAVVTIPKNFEANVFQKRYPELQIDLNMANMVSANMASRGIQAVLATMNAGTEIESLKKAGVDPAHAAQLFEPFKVNYNRLYNPSINYMQLMLPGILATVMQQVLLLGLAVVFTRDFEDGYLKKLTSISRVSLYHILLKALPFIILSSIMWMIVGSFFPMFHTGMSVFTWPMFVLVSVFTFACISLGMLFSTLFSTQLGATQFLMVLATPSFLLSGFTWPHEGMPKLIADIGNTLPLTHFLRGFRKLSIYGGTLGDVQPQLKVLWWIGAGCLALMIVVLQLRINKQVKVSGLKQ